jgi:hypothetical protein
MDSSITSATSSTDTTDIDGTEVFPNEIWKRILDSLPVSEVTPALCSCSLFNELIGEEAKVRKLCDYLGDYNDMPKDRPLIKQLHDFYLPNPTEKQLREYVKLRKPVWNRLREQNHPKPQISVPDRIFLLLQRYDICPFPISTTCNKYLRAIYVDGEDADLEKFLNFDGPRLIEPQSLGYIIASAKPQHYERMLELIGNDCTFPVQLFTDLQRLRDCLTFVLSTKRYNVFYYNAIITIASVSAEDYRSEIQNSNPRRFGANVDIGVYGLIGATGGTGPAGIIGDTGSNPYPQENRRPDFVKQPWEKLQGLFSGATFPSRSKIECSQMENNLLSLLVNVIYTTPLEVWIDSNGIKQSLYQTRTNKVRVSGSLDLVPILDQLRGSADKIALSVSHFDLERLYHAKEYELLKRIWIPDYMSYHRHSDPEGNLLMGHEEISANAMKLDPRALTYYESVLDQYPSYFLNQQFAQQLLNRQDRLYEILSPKIRWFLGCIAGFINKLGILQELITAIEPSELTESQLKQLLQSAKAGQAMTCYHWLRKFISSISPGAPQTVSPAN